MLGLFSINFVWWLLLGSSSCNISSRYSSIVHLAVNSESAAIPWQWLITLLVGDELHCDCKHVVKCAAYNTYYAWLLNPCQQVLSMCTHLLIRVLWSVLLTYKIVLCTTTQPLLIGTVSVYPLIDQRIRHPGNFQLLLDILGFRYSEVRHSGTYPFWIKYYAK